MNPAQFYKTGCCLFLAVFIVFGLYSYSWSMPKNTVSDVRFGRHKSFERVAIDLSHKPEYRLFSLKGPDRLVVDIDDCILPLVRQEKNVEGKTIRRIRFAQYNDETVRIVLDLKEGELQRIFYLAPSGISSHRIVLDIKPYFREKQPVAYQKSANKEISPPPPQPIIKERAEVLPEQKPSKSLEPLPKETETKDIIILADSTIHEDASVQEKTLPEERAFDLGGFVQAKGALDTKDDKENEQSQAFRNRIRVEGKWTFDKGSGSSIKAPEKSKRHVLASVESDYLWFGPDHYAKDYDLDLFEGYLYWSQGPYEFRIGKQIIRWGKTDQISPVDNLNSHDLREFIIPDIEDRKIPNWMARIRVFGDSHALEGVYIPFFEPSRIDYFGTDWAVYQHLKEDVRDSSLSTVLKDYLEGRSVRENKPAGTFENGEWGARVSSTIDECDISLSYLYAWEDLPYYESFPIKNLMVEDPSSLEDLSNALAAATLTEEDIEVTYKRSHVYGFEFETTAKEIGLRGEAAYFDQQSFLTSSLTSVRKPVFFYVLGADYSGESDWYINVQFSHQIISGYADDILYFRRDNTSLNGEITKEFWRGNLEAVFRYNYSLSDKSHYIYPKIVCKYVPDLEITLGLNLFGGDTDTLMGFYDANDQVFLSFKYSI